MTLHPRQMSKLSLRGPISASDSSSLLLACRLRDRNRTNASILTHNQKEMLWQLSIQLKSLRRMTMLPWRLTRTTIRSNDDCALGNPSPRRLNPLQLKLGPRRRSREWFNRVRARLSRPPRRKTLRRKRKSRPSVPALPTRRVIKMWALRPQRPILHPERNLLLRANLLMTSKSSRVSEQSLLLTALTRVHSRTLYLEKHGHIQRQLIIFTRCFFLITTAAQLLRYPTLIPQK
jgi:hypothetical protein